jgi:hypothetical protein
MEQPGPALAVPGAVPRDGARHGRLLPAAGLLQRFHPLHRHAEVPAPHEGQRPTRHRALQVKGRHRGRWRPVRSLVVSDSYKNYKNGAVSYQLTIDIFGGKVLIIYILPRNMNIRLKLQIFCIKVKRKDFYI